MKKIQESDQRSGFGPVTRKLSGCRAASVEDEIDIPESEEEECDDVGVKESPRVNATALVVAAAFETAVPKAIRRRLLHGQALAATVIVPTSAWVAPMSAYVKSRFGNRWRLQTRDGTDRRRDASVGNDEVARDLSQGACVIGIAADRNLLPSALTANLDIEPKSTCGGPPEARRRRF